MEILVCIKQVPATSEVEMDEATGVLKRDGKAVKINPYDLYALELGFLLKEAHGGRVDVLSMGPPQAKAALREALSMGADRGALLSDYRFGGADVLATGYTLAQGIRKLGHYDLVLCGKQTTDGDTAQTGPEVAELLGLPHASYVQSVEIDPGCSCATVQVNLGEVMQMLRLPLPCLLTVEKDIATPRLPSFVRSQAVSEEDILVLGLDDLPVRDERRYGLTGSPTQVERIFPPPRSAGRELVTGSADKVAQRAFDILHDEKYV